MIIVEGIVFSRSIRPLFPYPCGKGRTDTRRYFSSRFAGLDSRKEKNAKSTPALQGKFLPAPPSPSAFASAAHSVKGRFAFHSATLHSTRDVIARLQPTLLTTTAPGEISFLGRRYRKTVNARPAFSQRPLTLASFPIPYFSGVSFPLSIGASDAFPVRDRLLHPPRLVLSGSNAFACPARSLPFPQGCLFVRRHPGGPAYPTYIRAAALYTLGLARGFAPLTPVCPSEGSGPEKGGRR